MRYLFGLLLIAACSAYAQKGSYSLALVDMGIDYKEYGKDGTLLDSERSNTTFGFEVGYEFFLYNTDAQDSSLKFLFSMYDGTTEYVGSYLDDPNGSYGDVHSTTQNTLYDLSVEYSNIHTMKQFDFMYGLGLGYHAWSRQLSALQEELYSWFYVAPLVGVGKNFGQWSLGAVVRYKYGINPTMTANDISEDFKLSKQDTLEVDIPISYAYSEDINFLAEFIYARQQIGASNVVYDGGNGYCEPDSTDHQTYLKIGLKFKY